jgi:radical SAM protein with 4Fe4S-binding SPASM domain
VASEEGFPLCPFCDVAVESLNCPCCGAEVFLGGPERKCKHAIKVMKAMKSKRLVQKVSTEMFLTLMKKKKKVQKKKILSAKAFAKKMRDEGRCSMCFNKGACSPGCPKDRFRIY